MTTSKERKPQRLPWVRMRIDLHEDPVVHRLARTLYVDGGADTPGRRWAARMQIVGLLLVVWGRFRTSARDNLLPGLDLTDLDGWVHVPGFGDALVSEGWIEVGSLGLRLIDPAEYVGSSKEDREREAERKREQRARLNGTSSKSVPWDNHGTADGIAGGSPERLSVSGSGSCGEECRRGAVRTLIDRGGLDERQAPRIEERVDAALAQLRRVYVSAEDQHGALMSLLERRLAGHDPRNTRQVRSMAGWLYGSAPADMLPWIRDRIDRELGK